MGNDTRDPGTGKLTVWGYTERLAKLTALLLIPILLWAVRIEVFVQRGPRFTKEDAATLSLTMRQEWREELAHAIEAGQLPVAALRLDRLERDMAEVKKTVTENEKKLTAIQILLENGRRR